MPILGSPELTITLPHGNEVLGLQFAVYGTCTEIGPNNSPTITVKVWNGSQEVASEAATINNAKGTYEAYFVLDGVTDIQKVGKVTVKCDGMPGDPLEQGGLTIAGQTTLTIDNSALGGKSWARAVIVSGQAVNSAGKSIFVRLTDIGSDVFPPPGYTGTGIDESGRWSVDLARIVPQDRKSASSNYRVQVSLFDGSGECARISSPSFSVT